MAQLGILVGCDEVPCYSFLWYQTKLFTKFELKKLELFGKTDDFISYKHPKNSELTIFAIIFKVQFYP